MKELKQQYQRLYEELFALVMKGEWHSSQAKELRKRMDDMSPRGKEGDKLKRAWGEEVGLVLHQRVIS